MCEQIFEPMRGFLVGGESCNDKPCLQRAQSQDQVKFCDSLSKSINIKFFGSVTCISAAVMAMSGNRKRIWTNVCFRVLNFLSDGA